MVDVSIFNLNKTLNLLLTGCNAPGRLLINAPQVHACLQLHPLLDPDPPHSDAQV